MTDLGITHEAPKEAFVVDTADKAAWAVDKVLAARERLARIEAQCADVVARARAEAADAEAYFLPHLARWLEENPPRKGRTAHLPTGSVGFRRVPGGLRVRDGAAALAWAQQHLPDAVIQPPAPPPKVSATALRAHFDETGEVPAGAELVDDMDTLDVKGPKGGA